MSVYADPLLVLYSSPIDLQKKLNLLKRYWGEHNLEINPKKTKIMPFHKRCLSKTPFLFTCGEESIIEVVKSFCYLDLVFSSIGKFLEKRNQAMKKCTLATTCVKSLLAKGNSNMCDEKIRLLKSTVNATTMYIIEIWGLRYCDRQSKIYEVDITLC